MSPNGEMLPIEIVAEEVREWFLKDSPLPSEWDGTSLKQLVQFLRCLPRLVILLDCTGKRTTSNI